MLQVALWLTRTSTQDLYQEFTMSNLRSLINPSRTSHRQPLGGSSCRAQQEIHRNFSTKAGLMSWCAD